MTRTQNYYSDEISRSSVMRKSLQEQQSFRLFFYLWEKEGIMAGFRAKCGSRMIFFVVAAYVVYTTKKKAKGTFKREQHKQRMKRLVWWSFIDRQQLKNEERSQCALLKKANIECKSDTWWHNSTKLWWFSFQEHSIITQVEPKNVFRSWERSSVPEWGWVYGHDDFLAVTSDWWICCPPLKVKTPL